MQIVDLHEMPKHIFCEKKKKKKKKKYRMSFVEFLPSMPSLLR